MISSTKRFVNLRYPHATFEQCNNVRYYELYEKHRPHTVTVDDIIKYAADDHTFIRFTDVDKMGIFPLPYAGDARYISVCQVYGNVVNLGDANFSNLITMTYNWLENNVSQNLPSLTNMIADASRKASASAAVWWNFTRLVAYVAKHGYKSREYLGARATEVKVGDFVSGIWGKLLRQIGIDAIVDSGLGVIYKDEPTQIVVLDPRKIKLIKRFDNPNRQSARTITTAKQLLHELRACPVDPSLFVAIVEGVFSPWMLSSFELSNKREITLKLSETTGCLDSLADYLKTQSIPYKSFVINDLVRRAGRSTNVEYMRDIATFVKTATPPPVGLTRI